MGPIEIAAVASVVSGVLSIMALQELRSFSLRLTELMDQVDLVSDRIRSLQMSLRNYDKSGV